MRLPWSWDVIYKMHNRVKVSSHKYGDLGKLKKDVRFFRDELKNAEYRISLYRKTGNMEYLIDAMNFLMFEYMEMNGKFIPTDEDPDSKVIGDVTYDR